MLLLTHSALSKLTCACMHAAACSNVDSSVVQQYLPSKYYSIIKYDYTVTDYIYIVTRSSIAADYISPIGHLSRSRLHVCIIAEALKHACIIRLPTCSCTSSTRLQALVVDFLARHPGSCHLLKANILSDDSSSCCCSSRGFDPGSLGCIAAADDNDGKAKRRRAVKR